VRDRPDNVDQSDDEDHDRVPGADVIGDEAKDPNRNEDQPEDRGYAGLIEKPASLGRTTISSPPPGGR
jgi:hypothetical protein